MLITNKSKMNVECGLKIICFRPHSHYQSHKLIIKGLERKKFLRTKYIMVFFGASLSLWIIIFFLYSQHTQFSNLMAKIMASFNKYQTQYRKRKNFNKITTADKIRWLIFLSVQKFKYYTQTRIAPFTKHSRDTMYDI